MPRMYLYYIMTAGGDTQGGEQQTDRAIRQELVAMGEYRGGDMCCEQSTRMGTRHSKRSTQRSDPVNGVDGALNLAPSLLVHIPVSELYSMLSSSQGCPTKSSE